MECNLKTYKILLLEKRGCAVQKKPDWTCFDQKPWIFAICPETPPWKTHISARTFWWPTAYHMATTSMKAAGLLHVLAAFVLAFLAGYAPRQNSSMPNCAASSTRSEYSIVSFLGCLNYILAPKLWDWVFLHGNTPEITANLGHHQCHVCRLVDRSAFGIVFVYFSTMGNHNDKDIVLLEKTNHLKKFQ